MESSCVSVHTEEAGMGKEITFEIPYIRLRFLTELLADARMPETKTAALRGGMGEMMLRQNCVMDRNCGKCFFHKACIVRNAFYTRMEKKPAYVTGDEKRRISYRMYGSMYRVPKGQYFRIYDDPVRGQHRLF